MASDSPSLGNLIVDSYTVVLTRAPEESVRVVAAPLGLSERELAAKAVSITLASFGDSSSLAYSESGTVLYFTRENWFIPQRIFVQAPEDPAAEGRRSYNILHSVIQGAKPRDGGAYDGLAVLSVPVEVYDNDAADVAVVPVVQTSVDPAPLAGTSDGVGITRSGG